MSIYIIISDTAVQNIITRLASDYAFQHTGIRIHIGGLNFLPNSGIIMHNLRIDDHYNNPLLSAGRINILPSRLQISGNSFSFRKISLKHVDFNLITYEGDTSDNLTILLQKLEIKDTTGKTKDTASTPVFLQCFKTELNNITFRLQNRNDREFVEGMKYTDLEINLKSSILKKLAFNGDSITADIRTLVAREKSGFEVDEFSGLVKLDSRSAVFKNASLKSQETELDFDLAFLVKDWSELSEFVDRVKLQADFRDSRLLLSDLRYFSNSLRGMNNRIRFSGTVEGTVSNLYAPDIDLAFGSGTRYKGSARINGLPDMESTFMSFRFDEIVTKRSDLAGFRLPGGEGIELPEQFDLFGAIRGQGRFDGFLDDFVVKGNFSSILGRITTDLQIRNSTMPDSLSYSGMISTTGFNLGKLTGQETYMGNVSCVLNATGKGFDPGTMNARIDGSIQEIFLNQYNLTNIRINGSFIRNEFTGSFDITDKHLTMNFNGSADFSFSYPVFDFKSEIMCMDLNELNILENDSLLRLSTHLNIRLKGNHIDNLVGAVYIEDTELLYGQSEHSMKSLSAAIYNDTGSYREILVRSDFMDLTVTGNFQVAGLTRSLISFTNTLTASSIPVAHNSDSLFRHQEISFHLLLKDSHELTRLLMPEMALSKNTKISGVYDTRKNQFRIDGASRMITYAGIDIYNWKFSGYNEENALRIDNRFERVFFTGQNKNDSTALGIDSVFLVAAFRHDTLSFGINWNDILTEGTNQGDIDGIISLTGWPKIDIQLTNSLISVNDRVWTAPKTNSVVIDTASLTFRDFRLQSNDSEIKINGSLSDTIRDTLNLNVSQFEIAAMNPFLTSYETALSGRLTGNASIIGGFGSPRIFADLFIENMYLNSDEIGDIDAYLNWDNELMAADADFKIIYTGNSGSSPVLDVQGKYYPYAKNQNYDFKLDLNNLNLSLFNPFLIGFISKLEGTATGHFDLKGTNQKPDLTGKLKLMRTGFRVDYLNTRYSLADQIEIKKNLIELNNIRINDTAMNQAVLSGKITHNYLKDFYIDLKIQANRFSALNTDVTQNSMFYGKAAATGDIFISGPVDDMKFEINATSNSGTNINIPLNFTTEVSEKSFIVFVNIPETDTIEELPKKYSADLKGISLNMDLKVTPDAQIDLYLPAKLGKIEAKGSSDMQMNVNSRGDFSMTGDYSIDQGWFNFTFQRLLSKRFEIQKGSKISFTGNPLDAMLTLSAVYRTKPTLMGLPLATDTANLSKRVNTECVILLEDKLMNPQIRFNVRFQGLDDELRQLIYSTLDTNDQSVMSQQVISLLLLNSFSYSSTNTGTVAFSTMQMLSNQIGKLVSNFSDDFDIGLNYNPGSANAAEEFEVDLHGQLFNSRLIIDGNFGVKSNKTGTASNSSNIVGDVNIEYKVTPDGRFRVKAFNRTNDITLIEKSAPYTQGVGILYRKDFESFRDLFRRKNKEKRDSIPEQTGKAIENRNLYLEMPNNRIY